MKIYEISDKNYDYHYNSRNSSQNYLNVHLESNWSIIWATWFPIWATWSLGKRVRADSRKIVVAIKE